MFGTVQFARYISVLTGQYRMRMILGVTAPAVLILFTTLPTESQEREAESTDPWNSAAARSESDTHLPFEQWPDPPLEYAGIVSKVWADPDAIARGKKIWSTHCQSCHGADGKGTGHIGKSLSHLPADLSESFHNAPGEGDAYLFWRISEGGQVEPFKSLGSEMPSFKNLLDEGERWDVLAYVHAFFHKGLIHWTLPD